MRFRFGKGPGRERGPLLDEVALDDPADESGPRPARCGLAGVEHLAETREHHRIDLVGRGLDNLGLARAPEGFVDERRRQGADARARVEESNLGAEVPEHRRHEPGHHSGSHELAQGGSSRLVEDRVGPLAGRVSLGQKGVGWERHGGTLTNNEQRVERDSGDLAARSY